MESVWQAYGLVFIAFGIGFLKAGVGVGTGLFTSAIASLFLPPTVAIPFTAPLMLFSDLITLRIYRGRARADLMVKLVLPALMGTILGSRLLVTLSTGIIRQLIGFLAIIFVLYQVYHPSVSETPSFINKALTRFIFGFLAGIFSGFAHTGGVIITMYLVFLNLPRDEFIATMSQLLFVLNLAKQGAYLSEGLLPGSHLLCGFLLVPFLLLGGILAHKMNRCLSNRGFSDIILVVTWISGIALLIR